MMTPATDWSAARYLKFEAERTRPARDLLAQVRLEKPRRVFDIGCGPGNSTALLAARWPEAAVSGIDTSPDMLAEARRRLPHLVFEQADAQTWAPAEPVDLIFANAVLQWLPDHIAVLQTLAGHLVPGGVLAVQMPDNLGEPTHRLMTETAAAMPFSGKLAGAARAPLPPAARYYEVLSRAGTEVDIWRTTYHHPLAGAEAIVEWVRSTGLRPFLEPLETAEQTQFLDAYRTRIAEAYPPMPDGRVLLRFPRLFILVTRH